MIILTTEKSFAWWQIGKAKLVHGLLLFYQWKFPEKKKVRSQILLLYNKIINIS
jgi:hypothetical protein